MGETAISAFLKPAEYFRCHEFMKFCFNVILLVLTFFLTIWSVSALFIDANSILLSISLIAVSLLVVVMKGMLWSSVTNTGLFVIVLIWWLSLSPSSDRDWQADVAREPYASISGDLLTLHNIRNFDYRDDAVLEAWETEEYDLSRLIGMDMYLNFWGPQNIAHTIASWEFSDGKHVAISIETRKEETESYSAIRGFFRQFEIYYVVGKEQDLVKLRSNVRGETVYLYRLNYSKETSKELLLDYIREVNSLKEAPKWYSALTHNCTTAIRYHNHKIGNQNPLDLRMLLNGRLDEWAYEQGLINTESSFEELKSISNVTATAQGAPYTDEFHSVIRKELPARVTH